MVMCCWRYVRTFLHTAYVCIMCVLLSYICVHFSKLGTVSSVHKHVYTYVHTFTYVLMYLYMYVSCCVFVETSKTMRVL